ncbi:hypothetical protein L0244_10600 [bacterium]|nr:hypothetical protein [bacterium]
MNANLKQYGVPIIVGIIVLYFVFKYANQETSSKTSTINRLVPIGENNTAVQNRDTARVQAFSSLAQVAGQQITAGVTAQSEAKQLEGLSLSLISGQEIERIKSGLQRELGLQNLQSIFRQIEGQEEANRILSADRRYDIDAQLLASDRILQAQERTFSRQAEEAFRTLQAQISAVSSIGQQYRGQSLERQGTILNALSAIWGQPQVYNYQQAFGGPRPPTFLQQLQGFVSPIGRLFGLG